MRDIRDVGKYRQERFRRLPLEQRVDSCEFSDEIQEYSALEYLKLWADRLGEGYEVVYRLRDGERFYILIENQEE